MSDAPNPAGQEGRGLSIETVPLSDLVEDPRNARDHAETSVDVICNSLENFGQREPLVVWGGVVKGGNGRLRAMRRLGWTSCAITRCDDLTEAQANALAVALNRTAEVGTSWNAENLRLVVEEVAVELPDVDLAFSPEELVELGAAEPPPPPPDPPAPEPLAEAVSQRGDIITLGRPWVWCPKCKSRHEIEP